MMATLASNNLPFEGLIEGSHIDSGTLTRKA